jgi:Fe-S cluster biogenesis protein NfuA
LIVSTQEGKEIQGQLERLEVLIQDIEELPDPTARAHARELVQSILGFHGMALARLLDRIAEIGEPGRVLLDALAADQPVSSLLLLYGLHPHDLESRVEQALERIRPYLRSHGGNVELLGISEGVVRLRMLGSCNGCPSSSLTFKLAIEDAIYAAAPDAVALEVEGVAATADAVMPQLVTLQPLNGKHTR